MYRKKTGLWDVLVAPYGRMKLKGNILLHVKLRLGSSISLLRKTKKMCHENDKHHVWPYLYCTCLARKENNLFQSYISILGIPRSTTSATAIELWGCCCCYSIIRSSSRSARASAVYYSGEASTPFQLPTCGVLLSAVLLSLLYHHQQQ